LKKAKEIEKIKSESIGSDAPYHFSETDIEEGIKHVMSDHNRINHIFGKKMHNLDLLVNKLGGKENTIRSIINTLHNKVPFNGIINDIVINVVGYDIYVRGRVMNGILKIGTLFIKWKHAYTNPNHTIGTMMNKINFEEFEHSVMEKILEMDSPTNHVLRKQ
jgi:hypothetical protein